MSGTGKAAAIDTGAVCGHGRHSDDEKDGERQQQLQARHLIELLQVA
jgi:hypothetical protein